MSNKQPLSKRSISARLFGLGRGDTLVEVMLSIVLISAAISLAIAMAHNNLSIGIDSGKRSSGTAIAQGQIERIRNAYNTGSANLDTYKNVGEDFCLLNDGSLKKWSDPAKPCQNFNNTGFSVKDTYSDSSKAFTVNVTWTSASGKQENQLSLYYKLPSVIAIPTPPPPTPKPQCLDKIDNDFDGKKDRDDPSCHTDLNASDSSTYNPNSTPENSCGEDVLSNYNVGCNWAWALRYTDSSPEASQATGCQWDFNDGSSPDTTNCDHPDYGAYHRFALVRPGQSTGSCAHEYGVVLTIYYSDPATGKSFSRSVPVTGWPYWAIPKYQTNGTRGGLPQC